MQVADTSFLYALFSKSDVFHRRARKATESTETILIPAEILAETLSLIQYRRGFAAANDAGNWMRSQNRIQVASPARQLLDASWGIFRAARGRLSYLDAVVLAWCRERRARPLAFDNAILRRAKD